MRTLLVPLTLGLVLLSEVAVARPVVVELFTSQGCSSCPPADAFLTELAGRSDLLPLAFHVTYWNALGWRDPYSLDLATARQADYASRLGGGSYTPEIVVDGRQGLVGSERSGVGTAIAAARNAAAEAAVQVSMSGNGSQVTIGKGTGHGRILLVGFDRQHQTPVGRGENGGRTLTESNIVRSFKVIGQYTGLPMTLAAHRGAGEDAAVIIQAPDGRILGAAR